jgi:hypothetical protein
MNMTLERWRGKNGPNFIEITGKSGKMLAYCAESDRISLFSTLPGPDQRRLEQWRI